MYMSSQRPCEAGIVHLHKGEGPELLSGITGIAIITHLIAKPMIFSYAATSQNESQNSVVFLLTSPAPTPSQLLYLNRVDWLGEAGCSVGFTTR